MATGWHSKRFSFDATDTQMTVTHDIGVVPDIILINISTIPTEYAIYCVGGVSKRLMDLLKFNMGSDYPPAPIIYTRYPAAAVGYSSNNGFDEEPTSTALKYGVIRECNETTFVVGNSDTSVKTGKLGITAYTCLAFWCDGELYGDGSVPTPMMLTSSANRGGYQVVDLKNTDFTPETPTKISNIYNLVNSNSKAVMLSGIVINGETYNDLFISLYKVDYKYTAKVYDYYIVIDDENNVTFTSNEVTTTNNYIEEDDI